MLHVEEVAGKKCMMPKLSLKDLLPCLQYKNILGKYFMQYIQNGQVIHFTNALKNNICQN